MVKLSDTEKIFLLLNHDLRSYLGAVTGFSDLLLEDEQSGQVKQCLEAIKRNADHLSEAMQLVLAVSKVDADAVKIHVEQFSYSDFLNELLQLNAQLPINWALSEPAPRNWSSDKELAKHVFMTCFRLIHSLAIPGSEINVESKVLPSFDEDEPSVIATTIEAELENDFVPLLMTLEQMAEKRTLNDTRYFVINKFVKLLGGNVSYSPLGETKAVMSLALPTRHKQSAEKRVVETAVLEPKDKNAIQGKNILVVEDSSDNQILLRHFLRLGGFENVSFAPDGKEGVELALKESFDLILMDIQMPVCDGYEATQELRRQGFKNPIVALTAHAMKEERDKCLKFGFDEYLSKPINRKLLLDTVTRFLTP